jgi:cytochrome P450
MSDHESHVGRFDRINILDAKYVGDIRDPYPEFARMRDTLPVECRPSIFDGFPPSYIVYRHSDVTNVLRDYETFSSTIILDGMGEVWGPKIIVGMDPPEHGPHRALVSGAFRQRALARWEEMLIGRVVHQLIDDFIDRGSADLIGDYAFPFPTKVMAGVMGLPESDFRQFQEWAVSIFLVAHDYDRALSASKALGDYLRPIVEDRRRAPREDLVSDLVTAEIDGEALDDVEVYSFLRMLLPAGIETTFRSSGNLLYLLLTHPDQLEAVRADRDLLPQAIEEALRFESPVMITTRVATRDTVLNGVEIAAGRVVTTMLGSANRDPVAYPDPEVFNIFRDPKLHMSFGVGPHLCLGMHLARLETRVAVSALLDRLPALRLDEEAAERLDSHIHGDMVMRSTTSLPVVWD